jgi:alkylation response protein AidB-like acyl-CoA dehydrogenase
VELAPTPEQKELQASARRFLEREVTRERLAAWDRTPEGYDRAFWRSIVDLGWIGFSLAEAMGGQGASFLDHALLVEECGRGLAPPAIPSAVVAARLLAFVADDAALLGALARGTEQAAFACAERTVTDPRRGTTRVEGGRLTGEKWYVRQGVTADHLVVAARDGDGVALLRVRASAPGVARRELRTFGGDRQSIFTFEEVVPDARLAGGDQAADALAGARDEAAALALADGIGGLERVLETTVEYVKQREQFGQPIGKFQAVQFRCADMATALAASRHLAYRAIWRLSQGLDASLELAHARAFVGPAYKQATLDAHHLHGGAGYVVEHPLHRYAERAQAAAILFANQDEALEKIAAGLFRRR